MPTDPATWGRSPSAPVGLAVNDLQESTPQRMRGGCIAAERAWMSVSEVGPCTLRNTWPMVESALRGGTTPMTASNDGVSPDVRTMSALQVVPVLHVGPMRLPF